MFSIEQMMMQLSLRSRITSISYSFQPSTRFLDQHLADRRGIEAAGDDLVEFLAVVGDAAAGAAQREGRADDGRQADVVERVRAPPRDVCTTSLFGISSPILVIASRNSWRSSALSIASAFAPISSTPYFVEDARLGAATSPC